MARVLENDVKELLSVRGIGIPRGFTADSPDKAAWAAEKLPISCIVKALIPLGKKGKSGLVLEAASPDLARQRAASLLGREHQGFVVGSVLVEERISIERELYVSFSYDSRTRSPIMIFSPRGGVDIETFARQNPAEMFQTTIDILEGLHPFMAREICFQAGLSKDLTATVALRYWSPSTVYSTIWTPSCWRSTRWPSAPMAISRPWAPC